MSNVNVNKEFQSFGSKCQTLGILSILAFIFGLIANFVPPIGIINFIVQIIILIILFSALGNAKEAGYALNNRLLQEFRSKIILAVILFLIGLLFFLGGTMGLVAVITYAPGAGAAVGALIGVMIFGIILLIIAAVFRIQGWSRLQRFFEENQNMFPSHIGEKALSGAKLMKIGAILYLTIILMFIGFILEVVGYFKLAALKDLGGSAVASPSTQPAPTKTTTAESKKFCPNCGSSVTGQEKFCSSCGSEL